MLSCIALKTRRRFTVIVLLLPQVEGFEDFQEGDLIECYKMD